jgi:hypothetical protein
MKFMTGFMKINHLVSVILMFLVETGEGMQWHSWLKHYATSQKIVGSDPEEVIGYFQFT